MSRARANYATLLVAVEALIRAEHGLNLASRAYDRACNNITMMARWHFDGGIPSLEDARVTTATRRKVRAELLVDKICEELGITPLSKGAC